MVYNHHRRKQTESAPIDRHCRRQQATRRYYSQFMMLHTQVQGVRFRPRRRKNRQRLPPPPSRRFISVSIAPSRGFRCKQLEVVVDSIGLCQVAQQHRERKKNTLQACYTTHIAEDTICCCSLVDHFACPRHELMWSLAMMFFGSSSARTELNAPTGNLNGVVQVTSDRRTEQTAIKRSRGNVWGMDCHSSPHGVY